MLLRTLNSPNETIFNYKGEVTIDFRDGIADVPDKYAVELIASGQYELVSDPTFLDGSKLGLGFRPEAWSKERKLVFDTAIGYNNGYGKSGMMIAEALGEVSDAYVLNNGWIGYSPEFISPGLQTLIDKRLDTIDTFYVQYWPAFNFRPIAKRQIGYTMLETTLWPQSWVNNIHRSCERLIVPCRAQKQAAIDSGVQVDIEIIPLGLDVSLFPYIDRPIEDQFVFGIEGTLTYRKGVDIAIRSFKKAFPIEKYPDVLFHIKASTGALSMYFYDMTVDDPRIIVNTEWYSPEDLITHFFEPIDCYVFLSRGEGWSMTTVEAMATGLPVIGSDCSGVQDHLNNKVGYLIPTKMIEIENKTVTGDWNQFGYGPDLSVEGQMWWEADEEKAAEAMLDVYNNREKAKKKGKLAAKYVRDNFTNLHTAQKMIDYLDRKF